MLDFLIENVLCIPKLHLDDTVGFFDCVVAFERLFSFSVDCIQVLLELHLCLDFISDLGVVFLDLSLSQLHLMVCIV